MKKSSILILAAAALAACSKPAAPSATAQTLITGAGSTFDYPAFTLWFNAYKDVDSSVRFNYASIGSGGGQQQLLSQTVNFGASDAPMTDASMAKAPFKILHVPIVVGAVAITYNLPDNPSLKFDAATLSDIFLGKIKNWNDDRIAALNSGVKLPDLPIVVVHRSEGSGTSFIFTDYLSSVSSDWASKVGKGTSVKWPTGLGAKGSEGVAGQVRQLPGAICYVELAYALQTHMPVAELKNAAGDFITPSPESASKALATATIPDDFRFSMVNAPGPDAYPIAGVSWVLIYQKQTDADIGHKVVDFLKWAITKGQTMTSQLSYAPLPENVQQRELAELDTITYGQ